MQFGARVQQQKIELEHLTSGAEAKEREAAKLAFEEQKLAAEREEERKAELRRKEERARARWGRRRTLPKVRR